MNDLVKVKGDLIKMAINGELDMIFHGCNCFCTMGAGIAKQIRENFPEAYKADLETKSGDFHKLGNWTSASVVKDDHCISIYNLYTQFYYGSDKKHFEESALEIALRKLEINIKLARHRYSEEQMNLRLGFPLIGCGLAGGDPQLVTELLEDFANRVKKYGTDVYLIEYGG